MAGEESERWRVNTLNIEYAFFRMEPVRLRVVFAYPWEYTFYSKPHLLGGFFFCRHKTHLALMERSAALQLLESLHDQLVKLLRLRGERLHLVLSELRLKRQNLLKILCLGDLFDQRESGVGILLRDFRSTVLDFLESCDHGTCGHRAHPGAYGLGYEICELLIRGMRLLYVLFGQIAHLLRDFEWVLGHRFLPGPHGVKAHCVALCGFFV
jgi:hypothetical protein